MGTHGDTSTVSRGVRGDAEKPGVAGETPLGLCMLGMCLRVKEPGAGHASCWEGRGSGGWLNRHSPEPKGKDSCSGYIPKERVPGAADRSAALSLRAGCHSSRRGDQQAGVGGKEAVQGCSWAA